MGELYFLDGIPVPETPRPGEAPSPWKDPRVVGGRKPRVDAYERVSGTAVYPSDLVLPGMLHGAILRSPHPAARVRAVDTSAAEAMEGVRAVLTARDPAVKNVPWRYGERESALFPERIRFEGEPVAAVAADDPYVARDALAAIRVDYEVLPFVTEMDDALQEGAPEVHEGGNRVSEPTTYRRGDVEKGFQEAEAVVELSFDTACELHTPLELHGCVAQWEGEALTLWESTQGVYAVQSQVAKALDLPLARVRVIGRYLGGGFGSKLKAGDYTVLSALLARKTGRPVKLFVSRVDTMLAMGNRPPNRMRVKVGAKADGTLTAIDFEGRGTGGAFPAGGTSLLDWLARDLYTCPNVRTKTTDVFIHAGPARPFRAPGHPQGAWGLEQAMDALASKLDMDPTSLRLANVPEVSQAREGTPPYTTTGLARCIEEGAKAFRFAERRKAIDGAPREGTKRRGVGMAACLWFVGGGGPPSTVVVRLFSDGSANLNMGASDIGTGTKTVMALVVAEELGLHAEKIQIENADTGTTQYATPSGGSKTVPTESPAVRAAAIDVKRQLLDMASEHLGVPAAELTFDGAHVVHANDEEKRVAVTDIPAFERRGVVVGVGYRGPNPEGKVVNPFAAQFCEVEVDTRTGEIQVLDFLGAHDSGRVMDRLTYDNQVFGGITMGIGFALTEMRVLDHEQTGKLCNANWHDYKVPTCLDVPASMTSLPIDRPDPEANTTGTKGLGEPVTIPTAAAIANAIHHALGLRATRTPVAAWAGTDLLGREGR